MIKHSQKTHLLYTIAHVNILWRKSRIEGEEIEGERKGERRVLASVINLIVGQISQCLE
jgi:hypothetical protein